MAHNIRITRTYLRLNSRPHPDAGNENTREKRGLLFKYPLVQTEDLWAAESGRAAALSALAWNM